MTPEDRTRLLDFREQTVRMLQEFVSLERVAARYRESDDPDMLEFFEKTKEARRRLEETLVFTDYQLSEGEGS